MKPRIPEDSAVGKNLFHECSTCETLSCSILKECSLECINAISDEKKCSIYKKGDRILMEGIRSNGVYLIRSGRVKIYKADSDGEDFIIRLAGQGEV
ncbi:MAG: cyclic nucleotide-binding domain-containing protein, partial [Bacteroidia bacterium]|nr:cyclic nucleotide-binding domain-containing protein [Bacteroidia bacterium]